MSSPRRITLLIAYLAVVLVLGTPVPTVRAADTELLVSVAASLSEVARDIKPLFEAANPSVRVIYNVGSSGALQQQIEHGAPVDVFISAAWGPMTALVERDYVDDGAVHPVATNQLVLIAPTRSRLPTLTDWESLAHAEVKRVAVGNPGHVPAGIYAQQVLEDMGLWASLKPKLVLAEDVRQVLQYVRIGAVDAGVVYATDAATTPAVSILANAPSGSQPPIVYPAAAMRSSRHAQEAEDFVSFLLTAPAQAVFAKFGFGRPGLDTVE